eukprot:jgi/Botrbrau1/4189/Bobra.0192s0048.1
MCVMLFPLWTKTTVRGTTHNLCTPLCTAVVPLNCECTLLERGHRAWSLREPLAGSRSTQGALTWDPPPLRHLPPASSHSLTPGRLHCTALPQTSLQRAGSLLSMQTFGSHAAVEAAAALGAGVLGSMGRGRGRPRLALDAHASGGGRCPGASIGREGAAAHAGMTNGVRGLMSHARMTNGRAGLRAEAAAAHARDPLGGPGSGPRGFAGPTAASGGAPSKGVLNGSSRSSSAVGARRKGRGVATEEVEEEEEVDEEALGDADEEGDSGLEEGDDDLGLDDVLQEEEESWSEDEVASVPLLDTGGAAWGQSALEVARRVLARPSMHGLEIFSFRAVPSRKRLEIRLDKLEDPYGSPSLDDVVAFSRDFNQELALALGEDKAGDIEVEVSSPGAERAVRVPEELERFRELPMRVVFQTGKDPATGTGGTSKPAVDTKVLRLIEVDSESGVTQWALADVRPNRQGAKGSRLSKKQAALRYRLAPAEIRQVNLYIEL